MHGLNYILSVKNDKENNYSLDNKNTNITDNKRKYFVLNPCTSKKIITSFLVINLRVQLHIKVLCFKPWHIKDIVDVKSSTFYMGLKRMKVDHLVSKVYQFFIRS